MSALWLKSVPWSSIISNAPLIVDGAKKLVSLVKSKPAVEATSPAVDTGARDTQSQIGALRARIQRLEEEQKQAAELLRAMAESQAQMTQLLDALRTRARVSLQIAVTSLVGVAALLVYIWAH